LCAASSRGYMVATGRYTLTDAILAKLFYPDRARKILSWRLLFLRIVWEMAFVLYGFIVHVKELFHDPFAILPIMYCVRMAALRATDPANSPNAILLCNRRQPFYTGIPINIHAFTDELDQGIYFRKGDIIFLRQFFTPSFQNIIFFFSFGCAPASENDKITHVCSTRPIARHFDLCLGKLRWRGLSGQCRPAAW